MTADVRPTIFTIEIGGTPALTVEVHGMMLVWIDEAVALRRLVPICLHKKRPPTEAASLS